MFPFGNSKSFDGKDYTLVGTTPDKQEADTWAAAYKGYNYPVRVFPRTRKEGVIYEVYAYLEGAQAPPSQPTQ